MDWFAARGIVRTEADTVLLDVADIRQDEDYNCGDAAVDAALSVYGLTRPRRSKLANAVQGLSPDTVEAVLRALGLGVLSGEMTVDDLRHFTRAGRPVLCCVAWDGGHWVVVRGVERSRVHVQCPIRGRVPVPVAEWDRAWSDETVRGRAFVRWGIAPVAR
jgi:ABC-type bacteriocin/lantibiotic exporter with double-glycine peptidase domain